MSMTNMNAIEETTSAVDAVHTKDETQQWGQAILRAKTALIKPHSKVSASLSSLRAHLFNLAALRFSTLEKVFVLVRPTSRTQS